MTANELADAIGKGAKDGFFQDEIISILRQQQAEIESLKSIVEDTIGQAFYEDDYHKAQAEIEALKAHPVKELTDFEIKGVMALDECWIGEDCSTPNMIAFARAILKKASEK